MRNIASQFGLHARNILWIWLFRRLVLYLLNIMMTCLTPRVAPRVLFWCIQFAICCQYLKTYRQDLVFRSVTDFVRAPVAFKFSLHHTDTWSVTTAIYGKITGWKGKSKNGEDTKGKLSNLRVINKLVLIGCGRESLLPILAENRRAGGLADRLISVTCVYSWGPAPSQ